MGLSRSVRWLMFLSVPLLRVDGPKSPVNMSMPFCWICNTTPTNVRDCSLTDQLPLGQTTEGSGVAGHAYCKHDLAVMGHDVLDGSNYSLKR